jgi:hypothetical protein
VTLCLSYLFHSSYTACTYLFDSSYTACTYLFHSSYTACTYLFHSSYTACTYLFIYDTYVSIITCIIPQFTKNSILDSYPNINSYIYICKYDKFAPIHPISETYNPSHVISTFTRHVRKHSAYFRQEQPFACDIQDRTMGCHCPVERTVAVRYSVLAPFSLLHNTY